MQNQRLTEANILGYRLDRIDGENRRNVRYEVLGPDRKDVIGHFADRTSAERFIVQREMDMMRSLPRNPAY
jgi:hypothetical protein